MTENHFRYADERFADIQMLRYRLDGFENLTLQQKKLVYYLSEAALYGRDITFSQFGEYNLTIREVLEAIYTDATIDHDTDNFRALEEYLKRVWFSSGIYHHYGNQKFKPGFSEEYLLLCMRHVCHNAIEGMADQLFQQLRPVIFDPEVMPK